VTALEDRLRVELRAQSEEITPDSIVDLRLPGQASRPRGTSRLRSVRQWPGWARPLAAAAAVTAVIAGALAIARAIPGASPAPGTPATYSSAPAYYAYTVQGDIYNYNSGGTQYGFSAEGRYIKVRATATGKLLATVSPPKPYNNFSLLTAAANGRMFVFGAMRYWQRNAGPSPRLEERNQVTPMKFLVLRITPAGRAQLSGLSLPETLTPGQLPTIALSPDGTRLAVAHGGGQTATVQVITLTTGQVRQWVLPHTSWTPVLRGQGAWTANGQTLAFGQDAIFRRLPRAPGERYRPPVTTQVRLLDTVAPGTSLASGKLLVLHAPAGEAAPELPIITPDGTKLIGPVSAGTPAGRQRGELAVYSARTGALLDALAPWEWRVTSRPGRGGFATQAVAWSNRSGSQLIILQPRDDLNVLGVLTGKKLTLTGSKLLPQQAAGYQELLYALRAAPQMVW
jgi:DNA-binding beta-propeller fold protein YncE